MLTLTTRGTLSRVGRFTMVLFSIALAAAFVTASMGFAASVVRHYDRIGTTGLEGVDATVQAGDDPIGDAEFAAVNALPEVAAAAGDIAREGLVTVNGAGIATEPDGSVSVTGALPTLRVWIDEPDITPFTLVRGSPPQGDEVVLDHATTQRRGLEVGDAVTLVSPFDGTVADRAVTISGIARYGTEDGPPFGSVILGSEALVRGLTGVATGWTGVYAAAAPGVGEDDLVAAMAPAVGAPGPRAAGAGSFGGDFAPVIPGFVLGTPAGGWFDEEERAPSLLTGGDVRAAVRADIDDDVDVFQSLIVSFTFGALVVGAFVIANTFSILAAQRARELALLRALGAGTGAVARGVRLEAALVGAVASVVGAAVGVLVLHALASLSRSVDFDLPLSGGAVTPPWTWIVGGGAAFVVTVLASGAAVRRATRVRPIAALRDVDTADEPVSRRRLALGLVSLAAAAASAAVALGPGPIGWLAATAVTSMLATNLLLPVVVPALVVVVSPVLRWVGGSTGALAARNATRHPRRAAATANALVTGVGLVAFVALLAASVSAAVPSGTDDPQSVLALRTMYTLLSVAVFIAVVGVANTVGLSVLERTREIGLLRAVGATRGQVGAAVRWEAAILAVLGTVVGVVVGTVVGAVLIRLQAQDAPLPITVPYPLLALMVVVGGVLGVLAALGPARRAARLNVLSALRST